MISKATNIFQDWGFLFWCLDIAVCYMSSYSLYNFGSGLLQEEWKISRWRFWKIWIPLAITPDKAKKILEFFGKTSKQYTKWRFWGSKALWFWCFNDQDDRDFLWKWAAVHPTAQHPLEKLQILYYNTKHICQQQSWLCSHKNPNSFNKLCQFVDWSLRHIPNLTTSWVFSKITTP